MNQQAPTSEKIFGWSSINLAGAKMLFLAARGSVTSIIILILWNV